MKIKKTFSISSAVGWGVRLGTASALAFSLAGCSGSSLAEAPAAAEEPNDLLVLLDEYEVKMAAVIELLKESDDAAAIDAATRELVDLSLPILDSFSETFPECGDYLEASQAVVAEMDQITGEEIEKDYHQDGALPDGEGKCYHVKDLLVHPATVVVLLREGGLEEKRESMVHEIVENQAHLGAVRASLSSDL